MIALANGIQLFSGAFFDYNNPEDSNVEIDDIAHALSHVCRFAGHVSEFHSVAQHCVNVSLIVHPLHAYDALMHDTAEAFTNDIPTPLKFAIPEFKNLETKIETAMSERFEFTYPLHDAVKTADLQMLKLEKEALKPHASGDWEVLEGIVTEGLHEYIDLDCWSPTYAKFRFLKRFWELV